MLIWHEARHGLQLETMDAMHRIFVERVNAALAADDQVFGEAFTALAEHLREHFEHESQLMRASRFFATGEHEGEHRRLLGELTAMQMNLRRGRYAVARTWLREGVSEWFAHHLATMDAALAAWLKKHGVAQ